MRADARLGALQVDAEARGVGEPLELGFELGERMPVAGDEQQHRELAAEVRHAALADVAAALVDDAGQLVNHAGAVAADRRYGEVLLHLVACGQFLSVIAVRATPSMWRRIVRREGLDLLNMCTKAGAGGRAEV